MSDFLLILVAVALVLSGCAHRDDPVPCPDGCGGYWFPCPEDPRPWERGCPMREFPPARPEGEGA